MPTPRKGETRKDWMARCVPAVIREGKDPDEAVAQCSSMWDRRDNVQSGSCSCQQVVRVTFHAQQDGMVRREQHDAREHLVVPVVAVVEGVLNGNLVLASEFARAPAIHSWNGVPVPVGHPTDAHGNPVSANDPETVANTVIGRLYHVHVDGDRLKGEIWIDIEKAERIGYGELIQTLEAGEPMEVSTGYFAEVEQKSGVYGHDRYSGIHRNIAPDHLALLPDSEGACNWADGCGAPRIHEEDGMKVQNLLKALGLATAAEIEANAESLNDRIMAVRDAVDSAAAGDRFRFVLDVFESEVVFEEEGTLMRQSYSVDENGQVSLQGTPEQVRLDKQYVPVTQKRREDDTVQQHDKGGSGLTPEQERVLNTAKSIVNERREECIKIITADKRNPYTREQLDEMDFDTLKGLSAFAVAEEGDGGDGADNGGGSTEDADYSGRGGPAPATHGKGPEPLPLPGVATAANE